MTIWYIVDSVDYTVEFFKTEQEAIDRYKYLCNSPLYSPIYPQKAEIKE